MKTLIENGQVWVDGQLAGVLEDVLKNWPQLTPEITAGLFVAHQASLLKISELENFKLETEQQQEFEEARRPATRAELTDDEIVVMETARILRHHRIMKRVDTAVKQKLSEEQELGAGPTTGLGV